MSSRDPTPALAPNETWRLCMVRFLLLHALLLPISIVLGQPFAYLLAGAFLIALAKGKVQRPVVFPFWPWVVVIFGCAVVASIWGWQPERSFRKMDRFILLAVIPAVAMICQADRRDLRSGAGLVVTAFVLGTSLLAAADFVRIPMEINLGVNLFHTGNMRDPQFYMVSLCMILGAVMVGRWTLRHPVTATALIFNAMGLLLHFKRGAWISFVMAAMIMAVLLKERRLAVVLLIAVSAVVFIGPVRERISMVQDEFSEEMGGRYLLWTEVAPVLLRDHPLGVGWKAVRHEDLLAVHDQVENRLNHLHNNVLQIALEIGWLGALAWVGWMVHVLVFGLRRFRQLAADQIMERATLIGALGGFIALMINGMVEFNAGDSEIYMMLNLLIGLILCHGQPCHGQPSFPVDRKRGVS